MKIFERSIIGPFGGRYFVSYNPFIQGEILKNGKVAWQGGMPPNLVTFTAEHLQLQETLRKFSKEQILPKAKEIDRDDIYPHEIMKFLGELGILGAVYPTEYGGSGMDMISQVIIMEELARHSASVALNVNVQASLATNPLLYGNESQKQKYLIPALKFEKIGAFGLTEPSAGSDAFSMKSFVKKPEDNYILNGSKMFITQGTVADYAIVFARTDSIKSDTISAFIVKKDKPGFVVNKLKEGMMGMRGTMTSELSFSDVELTSEDLIGEISDGKRIVIDTLNKGRIIVAGISLGIMRACLEDATEYAKQRTQFDQPLIEFQGVRFPLANMATNYQAATTLTLEAARLKDEGKDFSQAAAMAKLFASEAAVEASLIAIQIFGGYGYSKEYPLERYHRDAILLTIGEGTSNMQREFIGRKLTK